jgi:hypothetical protein
LCAPFQNSKIVRAADARSASPAFGALIRQAAALVAARNRTLRTEVFIKEGQLKRGRIKILGTTIVVWLVLLVLALNVVAFVTRIVEKCKMANRLPKWSETTISIL